MGDDRTFERPDPGWLDHAAAVGVEGIADAISDACAVSGGVGAAARQRLLVPEPTGGWANPRLLGWVHEWAATAADRQQRGAYYTPPEFAAAVLRAALAPSKEGDFALPSFTVDPACGGGVFLLEVLDHLVSGGVDPRAAAAAIAGIEIDPAAAKTAQRAVEAWQFLHGISHPVQLVVHMGDALDRWPRSWPDPQLIVGNPPFASPIKSGSVPESAVAYRNHHSEVLGPYADLAAIHLWRAVEALEEGGRVAFVSPVSLINARDTAQLWRRLESQADVVEVIIPAKSPFQANVNVFVPVLEIRRLEQSRRRSLATAVGQAIGIPAMNLSASPALSTIAKATSGFRDEFYGLAEHVFEASSAEGANIDPVSLKLINVGSIDPLQCKWGQKEVRFAKRRWTRPVVDPAALSGKVAAYVERQTQPKVLVATQSPILEPLVDPVGDLVGVTPTLILTTDQPHHVAAMLLAPPVVAIAAQRWFGTGLSNTALRPTASTILELPIPPDREIWDQAAAVVADHSPAIDGSQTSPPPEVLYKIAELMNAAYGCDPEVLRWWADRASLPLGLDSMHD